MTARKGTWTLVLWAATALAVPAAEPPPFKDFTFRRVKPPEPGQGRRITIQIDPATMAPPPAPAAPAAPEAAALAEPAAPRLPGAADWFWASIAPELTATGPGRLALAMTALDAADEAKALRAPQLQTLKAIADRHGPDILRATIGTRVSPALVLAVIGVESGGRVLAQSGKGAQGLMQLMPATAARFAVTDAADPVQNIRGGVAYLDWLMGEFDNDPILVLAGYNAGEGAILKHGGVPPYDETRAYVPKVLAAWKVARLLCATPPELIGDGCVFAIGKTG